MSKHRLTALRALMAELGLDVYLVPSADEHQNEYLPAHRKRREAISGFTGSAGDVAVCAEQAHLFTDSRYHLQADQEVSPACFQVHKTGLKGEHDLYGWLSAHESAQGSLRVGYDPFLITMAQRGCLVAALQKGDSALLPLQGNLVDRIWSERPPGVSAPARLLPNTVSGEGVEEKLARLRSRLAEVGAGALVLNKLDEVAWLTNLRGRHIPYNPVFEAYLVVEREQVICYTDTPIPPEARETLVPWLRFAPYDAFAGDMPGLLKRLNEIGHALWLDTGSASEGLALLSQGAKLCTISPNPVCAMKAIKNPVEIQHSIEGHLKAGCAKIRAFSTLTSLLAEGGAVSEQDVAELLEQEYAKEENYQELSFTTISAFGSNAAIVHYATPDPEQVLKPGGLLLVDSGIQVWGSTTDDTRTIAIGEPDVEQKHYYTAVLRAHIQLATQMFPEGTNGQMLDAITRSSLWNAGADYGHGTGHGVGAFLNVHEGPQNISPRGMTPLAAGMVVSNEPGYYRPGWGGIRLENLMVVEEMMGLPPHPAGKTWLRLTPLTMIPFDRSLILTEALHPQERSWIDDYHQMVETRITPLLSAAHQPWLRAACQPL